jgi:hypothetical protein
VSDPPSSEDTQRQLEQRALRNVRGLVDKIDGIDSKATRDQKRMLVGLIVGVAVVVGGIVGTVVYVSHKQSGKPVVIDPAKLPPIRPGPAPK